MLIWFSFLVWLCLLKKRFSFVCRNRKTNSNFFNRKPPITCCNLYRSLFSRKRTSIAAPEKRSLEAYFAVQPRPSGEKIAAIAEKLDLKKNVVRVWFCNQRQKQKRMKFAAQHWQPGTHSINNGSCNSNNINASNNNSQNASASVAAIARQLSIGMNTSFNGNISITNGHNITNSASNMNNNSSIMGATNSLNGLLNVNGTHLTNGHLTNPPFGYSIWNNSQ